MNTTLKDIFAIIFRHIYTLLIFTCLVIILAVIYTYGAKKSYTSKAQILIRLGQEQMGSMQFMSNAKNVYVTRREQELKNEEMIFLSDGVATAAAKTILGVDAEDPVKLLSVKKYLSDNLEVKSLFESDTLSVSFTFPDHVVAKKILDILIAKFIEQHIGVYENVKELNFVKLKLDESKKNYEESLNKYSGFIDSVHIYDERQIEFLVQKINNLKTDLANAESEHKYHVQKLARANEEIKTLQQYEKFNTVESINDRKNRLRSKLNEARLERQNLLQKYTKSSRFVLDVDKEIEMLLKLINEEPDRIVDTMDTRKNDTYATIKETILNLKTTIAGEKGKIESLTQELRSLEHELSRNAKNLQQFSLLKKDLELAKMTYEKYYEGFLESDLSNMSKNHKVTNISIIEESSMNPLPDWPNKKKIFIFTGAFLIAGNFFLLMLFTVMNNTISDPVNIAKHFGQAPIITIPFSQPRKNMAFPGREIPPARQEALGLNYFRSHIKDFQMFSVNLTPPDNTDTVFLIGRSRPGEGGATITFNLAAFMVNYLDKKVAFIDYASSCVYRAAKGLTALEGHTFEQGQISLVDYFHYTGTQDFRQEDLRNKYEILGLLKEGYDYVFCNIEPIKDSVDLVFLNRYIDKVLFYVEADQTKTQVIKYNTDILQQYGFSKIAFVLNKRKFYIPNFLYKYV